MIMVVVILNLVRKWNVIKDGMFYVVVLYSDVIEKININRFKVFLWLI